jgi:hypothetical protein
VSLPDVCFKPFGTTCATQSILQFWQMNMTYYETGAGWDRRGLRVEAIVVWTQVGWARGETKPALHALHVPHALHAPHALNQLT